jgi:protein SCO1/2
VDVEHTMTKSPHILIALFVGLSGVSFSIGCGQAPQPGRAEDVQRAPESAREADSGAIRRYALTGVVRTIDRASGNVAIRHDAIPGYMAAMTMPFNLKGKPELDELQVGDRIAATLVVGRDATDLEDIVITELAEPTQSEGAAEGTKPLEPGAAVPDFAVTTQDGRTLRLSELRGKVVVLTFIYTRCPLPDYCPLMDRRFAELARRVRTLGPAADEIRLLSISFDPEHDTPEVLERHARLVGAAPPLWTFAVADHAELHKVAGALGLAYGPAANEIIHTLSTAVIARDGTLARLLRGRDWTVDDLFAVVARRARTKPVR